MDWICVAHNRGQWRALVNMVIKFLVLHKEWYSLNDLHVLKPTLLYTFSYVFWHICVSSIDHCIQLISNPKLTRQMTQQIKNLHCTCPLTKESKAPSTEL